MVDKENNIIQNKADICPNCDTPNAWHKNHQQKSPWETCGNEEGSISPSSNSSSFRFAGGSFSVPAEIFPKKKKKKNHKDKKEKKNVCA